MPVSKKDIILAVFSLALFAVGIFVAIRMTVLDKWASSGSVGSVDQKQKIVVSSSTLPIILANELALHNGSNPALPIYLALDGYVYDVSLGKKFYESGATYHFLAGVDASKSLRIMGGDIIKQKYPIIGIFSDK